MTTPLTDAQVKALTYQWKATGAISDSEFDGLLATIAADRARIAELVTQNTFQQKIFGEHVADTVPVMDRLTAENEKLREALKAAQEMHGMLSEAASKASCETQDNESEPWERLVHGFWFDGMMASYRDQFEAALKSRKP